MPPKMMKGKKHIVGEVRAKRMLSIRAKDDAGVAAMRQALLRLDRSEDGRVKTGSSLDAGHKFEADDVDGEGPNARGTYSKAYTLQHPEIKWVHRGQGRYLPLPAAKALTQTPSSQPQQRESRSKDFSAAKANMVTPQQSRSLRKRRSSFTAEEQQPQDRTSSLRRRVIDAQTNTEPNMSSARQSRRAKLSGSALATDLDRRSSRNSNLNLVDYDENNSNEEPDSDNEMANDDENPTFDRAYVDSHPGERFYHTGNGWYKRGRRPPMKNPKKRETEGHATKRLPDGSYAFNRNTTIHVSQLELYPGVEFHHRGNGWYRAGADATGLRASRFGGPPDEGLKEEPDDDDDDGDEVPDEDRDLSDSEDEKEMVTVSKAYAKNHPEVEWVHRGKGRYMRKTLAESLKSATPGSASIEPERDQTIYSKTYVLSHPREEFHHRGNAKYMRGPPPEKWAVNRKKKISEAVAAAEVEENDGQLFSKAFVDAHPELEFHHRGQGRYARGPRRASTAVREDEGEEEEVEDEEEEEEEEEEAPDGLVDTDYVTAHPHETFHHRGQGRWARGLPPPGSSRKTAIRGPGREKSYGGEQDEEQEQEEEEVEQEPEGLPDLAALVPKADGPDKFPDAKFHYRGGGKWSRITKAEFEDLQMANMNASKKTAHNPRVSRKSGPEAQLEREAAAARAMEYLAEEDEEAGGKAKGKRKRVTKRGSYITQEDGNGTKASSNGQSKAPTPKPRMLEPEEDILTEEDLPQLYRDDWSPPSEYIADPTERLGRSMRPLTNPDKFVKSLTKFDPASRSLDNLKTLAANTQQALDQIQQEYLDLDKITAPHARIPRKLAKGGRAPIDPQIFEDRKEADLYDYAYDPRRLGFQDPAAQKIQRDAEGRELRNRRQRAGALNGTIPGWNFGEEEITAGRRAVKPVNRFDGIVEAPRKRQRMSATAATSKAPSMTPDRGVTPLGGPLRTALGVGARGRGLVMGNVPKRIQELRGVGEVGRGVSEGGREGREGSVGARKGRPPGSKNLFRRRDAGIKKGPRKGKGSAGSGVDGEGEGGT
ncbi:uncharacterized protein LTR77_008745 [Saxophila tyrrhenica]|uniref:Uncharacterized protein n=1 Tax=Saxophila tyrrhenica TaxID=1690608 RepID=A0AAV9P0Y0_9PEZI|nr:hypothetical protein LTR77_008745 [Saxophila tyrrhenica]